MIYEIEVRPGSSDFFTPYKETVEANTSYDALARVKRRNPGCQVFVTNSYNAPINRGGGGSSSAGGCGTAVLLVLAAIGIGLFSGGEGDKSPSETPQAAPIERPAPEPQIRNYANPPGPCVTNNFEPC